MGQTVAENGSSRYVQPGVLAALVLLIAINLFNFVDRQVLAAVEPEIRKELLPQADNKTAKFLMGLLSAAFLVTYMITAPLFGWLAGRMPRWWIVGIGVAVWSLASGASGVNWHADVAIAFWLLLVTRLFVGVGEGGYGPVAPTMLSDLYPVSRRGFIIALFYLAMPVGGALGYVLGENVKEWRDWRWAFYLVMPPGLLLGLLCFFMREPKRGGADADSASGPGSHVPVRWRESFSLLKIPSFALCVTGMTGMSFAMGALAFWMPDFLEGRLAAGVPREAMAPLAFMGFGERSTFGVITAVAGFIATLTGGVVGDWLRGKVPGSYFVVSGIAMTLGFPLLLLFLWAPFPLAWVFGFLVVFCLFFNTGPCNTVLANVTNARTRTAGFALNILIMHALGDVISPPLVGYISGVWDMDVGFIVVSAFMAIGGLAWLYGARFLDRDTELAPTRG